VTDGETALLLARLQFAFTISFHFVFPAFSIGLASWLAVLEGLWLRTGRDVYLTLFRHWLKIFAIVFAMGVVSGITMSYQFGTNWSVFSDKAGPIVGPLMAYEVLTAFFLEAGFLGVMLFGLERVGKRLHFLATLMVAGGTALSAFWILSVNSWMQTPAGWAMNDQRQFVPAGSWVDIIFNPSFPYRFAHTVIAAYLTTALVIGGAAAWHLLRGRDMPAVRIAFSMAMWMAALVAPVQIVVGDLHALNTFEHQPAKILAIEGYYQAYPNGAPWHVIGLPDDEAETVRWAVTLPYMGSLGIRHDMHAPMPGLDALPKADRPSGEILFWSFRLMVALGFLMAALGLWSLLARLRRRLYEWRLLHRFALVMAPAGFVAVIAGWITTEVGRQPWVIYGLLRTKDAVSPIAAPAVGASLIAFVIVYFTVFAAGTVYILKLMGMAPGASEGEPAGPIRTAGITPAAAAARDAGEGEEGQ
jgi:cytochrome d ubiquinol oxidase subunit I